MAFLKVQVDGIRKADPAAFIVYFPHWGENYKWKTAEQTATAHACIDAGVNLVIGHGAHMLQEIEQYRGKWIAYSIGNLMFNAAGRYAANKVDPFSLPAILNVRQAAGRLALSLELYPIVSDNKVTGYQPRPVTPEEFSRAQGTLFSRSPGSTSWGPVVGEGARDGRRFLAIALQ
jgi:hypothetical protein